MKFQRVLERQWLCDNRVLYLSVQAQHTYSGGTSEFTSKVVYDFERNEMHTFYPGIWEVWPPEHKGDRRTQKGDIDAVLSGLKTSCQGVTR